jgi:uncharacterized protein
MPDASWPTLGLLFLVSLVAGIVNVIAGSGGLITLPVLLGIGLPPLTVVATNKVQMVFSSLTATLHFWRSGKIKLRSHILPSAVAFVASACGSLALSFISPDILKLFIPFVLIAVALWILFSPNLGETSRKTRLSPITYALAGVSIVAFYDGFIGPGVGTFFAAAGVGLSGLTLSEATIRAKLYNSMSNLGSVMFFLLNVHIVWIYVGVMAIGMIIGGTIGARLVLSRGTALIRPALVLVSLAMSAKLIWQQGSVQKLLNL